MRNLVLCIDDTDKPNEIPDKDWIEAGEVYTVQRVLYNPIAEAHMFDLLEVKTPAPFGGYTVSRFVWL